MGQAPLSIPFSGLGFPVAVRPVRLHTYRRSGPQVGMARMVLKSVRFSPIHVLRPQRSWRSRLGMEEYRGANHVARSDSCPLCLDWVEHLISPENPPAGRSKFGEHLNILLDRLRPWMPFTPAMCYALSMVRMEVESPALQQRVRAMIAGSQRKNR